MSFKQAVLLVIVIFIFITFAAGYADPDREVNIEPGFIPVLDEVID